MQRKATLKPAATRFTAARPPAATQPATLSAKRFSPSKLAALIEAASKLGLDASGILAGTGLDSQAIADPFTLTSSQQFLTAARNAVRLHTHSDLGVRVGCLLHASSYGMFGYAMLCSETMAQAFDSAVRFHQLSNGLLDIRWAKQGDTASWFFPSREEVMLPELDSSLHEFLIDLQFAVHVTVIKDVMGGWCLPARAQFSRDQPAHAALLSEALECPVTFDQPGNVLSYPAAWLSRAPQLAHPITAAQVSSQCAQLLEELRSQSAITRRVYEELTRTPGRFPEIEAIAEGMCMSARTLHRKLDAAGTSYSELLTNVRKALAIDYLDTTTLSIEDIAQALSFSDAVSFRHAFKRWTGKNPSEVRHTRGKEAPT
ncbi:AraC family transcriptional regulator [Paraburkholderia sp. EG287A]|uniref:AraC family transcriptional regulator n=1 Tax=unclassified Paraburkholderia TaxID=2615204 RepID=UPI0034D1E875